MKALIDLFPVAVFFAAYYLSPNQDERFFIATGATIVATIVQVGATWGLYRKVEKMHLITLGLVVGLGGLTLFLHDKRFLMWKPTLVNWAFALAFLGSLMTKRSLIERMMDHAIALKPGDWRLLNLAWTAHFTLLGIANLLVAWYCSEATWVNFKLFGLLGLTLVFVILQGVWLARVGTEVSPQPED